MATKPTKTEAPLGMIQQRDNAWTAAGESTHLLMNEIRADNNLIAAATELMKTIERVRESTYMQHACQLIVKEHEARLTHYFTKYGVKLVPNMTYVGAYDLALESYKPDSVGGLVDMGVAQSNVQQVSMQQASAQGKQDKWNFPIPKSMTEHFTHAACAGPCGSGGR
jgi:hypothetical protein